MGDAVGTGGAGRRRTIRIGATMLVLLLCIAPFAAVAADWAAAVRTARSGASEYAWNRAGARFLGIDWRAASLDPRIIDLAVHEPPGDGAYTGYRHATRVELSLLWQPRFRSLTGGPYRIKARATAAVLRSKEGKWMPVLVE